MKMDKLNCSNRNYLTIFQCSFSTDINSECNNADSCDATVYCCECINISLALLHSLQIPLGSGTVIHFQV